VSNPFAPPAQSWLVLPLVSEKRLVGVVVASAERKWSLCPTAATVLTLLGDLVAAGIATARLRQQLEGAEIERERARLAAEIHDGLAQDLALAMRELALLESEPPPEQARASAERLREAISSARRVVRARLEDLSVHIPLGGVQAVVEEVSARRGGGLPLSVRYEGPAVDVSPETTAVVVRVLTEALANSARHAQPEHVSVLVRVEEERLMLVIEDDGVGFQPTDAGGPGDGHFGLTLMRERRLDDGFDEALGRGMTTLWSSHTPVRPDSDSFAFAMEVERAWEEHFRGRPVVTLCPYIVGGLDAPSTLARLTGLGAGHDGVLVPAEQGVELFRPARAPDVP
jgi:two-component sensor histidine kinase